MKLDRFAAIALTLAAIACSAGCATSSAPQAGATTAAAAVRYDAYAVQSAAATAPNAVGTTTLMSAELNGPAPRVGKAHLAIDENDALDTNGDENAPKEARRSDGSHRSGSFGTLSK